ncbi:MAG: cupin domain-containing protein [Pseudorhodobacter sp.]|nr:cupin domain-containing protein [Pseudorhodobacter sp.]
MPVIPMPKLTQELQPIHPILGAGNGPYSYAILGEAGGLTQFGVHIEVLPPGSRSSFRHWHEAEDEMILMLEGEVILIEDTETLLRAGDVATWAKAVPIGHCLENRSTADARYLTVGTRLPQDIIHYPDHDLIAHKDNTSRRYTHADGRPRASDW